MKGKSVVLYLVEVVCHKLFPRFIVCGGGVVEAHGADILHILL